VLSSPVASNEAPAVLLVRSCDGLETREDSSRLLYMNTSFSEFDKNWWGRECRGESRRGCDELRI
jgi:hypothetical protein